MLIKFGGVAVLTLPYLVFRLYYVYKEKSFSFRCMSVVTAT